MKKLGIAVVLFMVCLIGIYYQFGLQKFIYREDTAAESNTLNFYIEDLIMHSFNERGEIASKLSAQKASQLISSEKISLEHPRLDFDLEKTPWIATANNGFTNDTLSTISLSGEVKLTRHAGAFDVSTETLVFDSVHGLAYTADEVTILAKGSKTHSTGVEIDLNREIVQLKNNVKTFYVPKKNRSHNTPVSH